MRKSASEIINNLEMRIARLEKQAIFGLFEKNPLDTVHGWFLKGLKDNRAVNSDVKMDKDNRLSGKFKFEGEVYQVSLKREGKDTAEYKITGGNRDFRQVDFELSGANDSKMSERNFIKRVVDQVIYRVGQESARKEVEEHQKMVNQERDRLRKQGRIARLEKQASKRNASWESGYKVEPKWRHFEDYHNYDEMEQILDGFEREDGVVYALIELEIDGGETYKIVRSGNGERNWDDFGSHDLYRYSKAQDEFDDLVEEFGGR